MLPVKECQVFLISPIRKMVNESSPLVVFPRSMNVALVKYLLKQSNLEGNVLDNYRFVSNLTLLSDIIETALAFHLSNYVANNNLKESVCIKQLSHN